MSRFKQLLDNKEIPKELYSQFNENEPRNVLANAVNPLLDKYVNPSLEKVVRSVNEYSPLEISENINIPKVSQGEVEEFKRNFPESMALGFSGGLRKVGGPALEALKKEVTGAASTASKRDILENFLNQKNLPEDVFDSAEKMKRLIVQRQNAEKALEPIPRNTDANLENLKMSKLLEAKDIVEARRRSKQMQDKAAADLEQIELNKILNPDDATNALDIAKKKKDE